jgi:hypothetical protein
MGTYQAITMSMQSGALRIYCGIAVALAIVLAPWWLTWILAIAFLFIFPNYYEILLWGILYDSLYGLPLAQFGGSRYVFSIAGITLFVLVFFLKKYLAAYEISS